MKVKKKLDGGLKKILTFFLFFCFASHNTQASQILDYETEKFINEILTEIKKVNKINKKINFKINNNENINAFVDHQNTIHINSGLIQYAHDYVALLSVLAHEVGHIDLNHISIRKQKIENYKRNNNLTLLSVIAGSAISQRPELLQSTIISSAAITDRYIEFSKEQEIEADLYSLKTLSLLNTYSDSIIKLLKTIDKKLLEKGLTKDLQRISSHPYLEDRIILINNYKNDKLNNFNDEYNKRFNFIKAKFIGYNENNNIIENLEEPFKTYAKSIRYAMNGNLKESLKNLNYIIKMENEDNFLLETKADILFSYGYTKESIKFYRKNLEIYPSNFYAQIRIFENLNNKYLSYSETEEIFDKNKDLLYKYYNNKNILLKYRRLAEDLNKKDWLLLLDFVLSYNDMNREEFYEELDYFRKTKDKDLLKFLKKIERNIL